MLGCGLGQRELIDDERTLFRSAILAVAKGKRRIIASLGNIDMDRVTAALSVVVFAQPAAKPACLYPHRSIDRRIVIVVSLIVGALFGYGADLFVDALGKLLSRGKATADARA